MSDVRPTWAGRVLFVGAAAMFTFSACGSGTDASIPAAVSDGTIPLGPLPALPSGPTPVSDVATTTILSDVAPTSNAIPPLTTVGAQPSNTAAATAAPPQGCARVTSTATVDNRVVNIESPETTSPAAVIVAVHGYKGTPEGLARYSSLTTLADAGVAMVLYPSGAPLDLGFGWNSGATKFATTSADDVAILSDIVDAALALPCADPSRVYLVGESNGGGMVLRAACDARFAARLSGIVLVNPAIDKGVLATCSPVAPAVPVLAVAGVLDRVVGYDGSRNPFIAAESWFGSVAPVVSGCSGSSSRGVSSHVTAHDGSGCASCATLYTIDDGGHTWPGAAEAVNGAAIGSFPLTDVLGQVVTCVVNGCGA